MTDKFNAFVRGYIECALWAESVDPADGEITDTSYEQAGYTVEDIDPHTLAGIQADCWSFYQANESDLDAYDIAPDIAPSPDQNMEYAGHDFWLTRNGHGAGFWDRGLGTVSARLSEAAAIYGACYLYVDDHGRIQTA